MERSNQNTIKLLEDMVKIDSQLMFNKEIYFYCEVKMVKEQIN